MYQKVSPMLLVDDVDQAEAWYRSVFGAEFQYCQPQDPPYEWVSLLLDDVEIMIGNKGEAKNWYSEEVQVSETPTNFIVYIYVEHINELYQRVHDKVKIIMHPSDQFYDIREFAVRDAFGFVFVFAEILE